MKNLKKAIVVVAVFAIALLSTTCGKKPDVSDDEGTIEKFVVSFSADDSGGTIKAEVDGKEIYSENKVEKGKIVKFTAIADEKKGFRVKSWEGLEVNPENATTVTLTISKNIKVKVSFLNIVPEGFVLVPVPENGIEGEEVNYPLPADKLEWKGVFVKDRKVKISPYAIAQYEVTYALWKEVYDWAVGEGKYKFSNEGREGSMGIDGEAPSKNKKHPVTKVSWRDCIIWCNAYTTMKNGNDDECVYRKSKDDNTVLKDATKATNCDSAFADMNKKGFRLPTDAEWELAARWQGEDSTNAIKHGDFYLTKLDSASGAVKPVGFNGVKYNGVIVSLDNAEVWKELRDEATRVAVYDEWYCGNASYLPQNPKVEGTAETGTKAPNMLKLYDMNGNVAEWCFDGNSDNPTDNDDLYLQDGLVVDPLGTPNMKEKIKRGIGWFYSSDCATVGLRDINEANYKFDDTGFRLACSIR